MNEKSLYQSLLDVFDRTPIIDSHEHLPHEAERLGQHVDFATLFSHYCFDDFYSAGMSEADWSVLQDPATDLERKWALFARYYPLVKDTSYVRSARIAMEHFYGCGDLQTLKQAEAVTAKMQALNRPGLYDRVLKDACHMEHSFLFTSRSQNIERNGFYQYVDTIDDYCHVASRADAERAAGEMGGAGSSVDAYAEALHTFIQAKAARGVRGLKYVMSYYRTLEISPTTRDEAVRLWERLPADAHSPHTLTDAERLALQDYFLRETLRFCGELGLPAVFHTGIHAGTRCTLGYSDPLLLNPVFKEFPNVKFVLLHCGIPWTEQAAILAKYFQNVWIDMAWLHIVSPAIAVEGLKRWMDLLPMNKIIGFGGDYLIVEKVYGHLQMARENLCRAIAEKGADLGLTEARAALWLRSLLHDNPEAVYFPERK